MDRLHLALLIVLAGCATTAASLAQGDPYVPPWVRDAALWWGQGLVSDSEFLGLVQFLVDRDMITVPPGGPQVRELQGEVDRLKASNAAGLRDAYDRGYADGLAAAPPDPGVVHGTVTRNIDGNTIEISGQKIRLPFVDVEDSGNASMPHAKYARELCPVGAKAHYDVDDDKPVGKYGRTIAMVWCGDHAKPLDQLMVESGLGWISKYWCERSEFQSLDWVDGCRAGR